MFYVNVHLVCDVSASEFRFVGSLNHSAIPTHSYSRILIVSVEEQHQMARVPTMHMWVICSRNGSSARPAVEPISKDYENFKKTVSATRRTKNYVSTRLETLGNNWQTIVQQHQIAVCSDENIAPIEELFNEAGEIYTIYKSVLLDELDKFAAAEAAAKAKDSPAPTLVQKSTNDKPHDVRLPKIHPPTFTGEYQNWRSFHDQFVSLVHNNTSLTKIEKLHYLKSSCKEGAGILLEHISVDDASYDKAWELLTSRYDFKRILVNNELKLFYELSVVKEENAKGIRELLDNSTKILHALKNLPVHHWDAIIIFLLLKKLPATVQSKWETTLGTKKEIPTFKEFSDFLETSNNFNNTNQQPYSQSNNFPNAFNQQSSSQGNHNQFQHNTNNNNTFSNNPRAQLQTNTYTPTQQNNNRNTFAHTNINTQNPNSSQTHHVTTEFNPNVQNVHPYDILPSTSSNCFHLNECKRTQILLATAIIKVKSAQGDFVQLRALIDPGSQATFITESAVQLLGLKKIPTSFDVSVLGQNKANSCKHFVNLNLSSNYSDFITSTRGYIYKTLTGLLPNEEVFANRWKHLQGLKLADPSFNRPGNIDILLGNDIYCEILLDEVIRNEEQVAPIAQKTRFGWIVLGKVPLEKPFSLQVYTQLVDIDTQMRAFWEMEETPYEKAVDEEDVECEKHFLQNTKRVPGGRFEVSLPFKELHRPRLMSTKQKALMMFYKQEKKLLNNPTLHKEYNDCLKEYLTLNQMEEVDINIDNKLNSPFHYVVPHHAVMKETSTTTKLRVVFNAAYQTADGSSLNDHLMTGPKTQTDILAIVLRWRTHKITFVSDIEKMYRQILVHPEDAYYQLLFWRENPSMPIKLYKVKVLMFGTAPAPYLANRTLKKLASDEEVTYPLAAQMIREDMYIDDLVSGADSVEVAKEKYHQISKLLSSAGFHLRKWMSNNEEFLASIPKADQETNVSLTFGALDHTKTLGISWFPSTDSFSFKKISIDKVVSKRTILSTIARLFDPLGWIAPCIVKAKIIMQQLWLKGLSWDENIPVELLQEWLSFQEELDILEDIRIPRWVNIENGTQQVELHGFCDASTKAYGAVVYLRVLDNQNCIHTHLLIAKTKVAPVSTVSLPRLELCGAVMLAKLLNYTKSVLPFKNISVFAWTDSTITLCWISGLPSKWRTFIANRVTEIQRLTNVSMWKHIPTKLNPADLASRGVLPSKLRNNNLWWKGPLFLQEMWRFSIPEQPTQCEINEEKREIKTHLAIQNTDGILDVLCKQSKLTKALRIIANVHRFIYNSRKRETYRRKSVLTPLELDISMRTAIRSVQKLMFHDVINELQKTKRTKLNKSLNLFIDGCGILRIGGRLQNATLTYDQKHPIVLKPDHNFSRLIIEDAHEKTLHGGIHQVIAHIRNRFWIFNMKRTVKKYINKCFTCFKNAPKPLQQLMGSLPAPRVNVSRPFTHTGVDYAGPIEVKAWKGRGAKKFKGYFAIFICLSTKAIHLEAVTDLTTQAFIAAFRRFTSRRGICANIYSDCGTNFKGANVELQKMLNAAKLNYTDIANSLSALGTNWNFIPPASPHFGGLWEAGVKSVKYHLRRVARNQALTFEELSTLLAQIEACLNSRPLCPVTDSLEDFNALTPAHFLIGTSAHIVPEADLAVERIGYLDRWKRLQASLQTFWKEWSGEYLTRLQNRPKWLKIKDQPKIGDLVLVRDERFPPSKWPMARIVETYPGQDDLIRVVKTDDIYENVRTDEIDEAYETDWTDGIYENVDTDEIEENDENVETDEIDKNFETGEIDETDETDESDENVQTDENVETDEIDETYETDLTDKTTDKIYEDVETDEIDKTYETDGIDETVETDEIEENDENVETDEIDKNFETGEIDETDETDEIEENDENVETDDTDEIDKNFETGEIDETDESDENTDKIYEDVETDEIDKTYETDGIDETAETDEIEENDETDEIDKNVETDETDKTDEIDEPDETDESYETDAIDENYTTDTTADETDNIFVASDETEIYWLKYGA
ncbi:uncharacterized protein LOC129951048 [Eupeodes corollae]|uniref:uncharacterized protein LOC129951048 n=1 Tax=Eupeodes corollae TaxID=290404 RepID=UPI002491B6E5|nr:uncharacterized protein LOC129951048 [Eupeodes corollae]